MLNALNQDLYLIQYRIAIKKGEIIAGQELIMELDRLINDLGNPRYYYDIKEFILWKGAFVLQNHRFTESP